MELSLQQTADILGKTRRQVLYMIDQGRLPGKKVGGRWVVDRAMTLGERCPPAG